MKFRIKRILKVLWEASIFFRLYKLFEPQFFPKEIYKQLNEFYVLEDWGVLDKFDKKYCDFSSSEKVDYFLEKYNLISHFNFCTWHRLFSPSLYREGKNIIDTYHELKLSVMEIKHLLNEDFPAVFETVFFDFNLRTNEFFLRAKLSSNSIYHAKL